MTSPTLGARLLRVLLLVAGAVAAFLLWSLLTSDAAAAAAPEATPGKVIDVDLDVGAPTPGAPLSDALPPLAGGLYIDPAAAPPLARAPFEPLVIEISTAPPRLELPPLLPPVLDSIEPPTALETRAADGSSRTTRERIAATGAIESRARPELTNLFGPAPVRNLSTVLPNDGPGPAPAPAPDPNTESDSIPVPPLPLWAVLGTVFMLAALMSRDWSGLTSLVRSTLLAPALDRPG